MPQRFQRIHFNRSARGDVARQKRGTQKNGCRQQECQRIERFHSVELAFDEAAANGRNYKSRHQADTRQTQPFTNHKRGYRAWLGAQREAGFRLPG